MTTGTFIGDLFVLAGITGLFIAMLGVAELIVHAVRAVRRWARS